MADTHCVVTSVVCRGAAIERYRLSIGKALTTFEEATGWPETLEVACFTLAA